MDGLDFKGKIANIPVYVWAIIIAALGLVVYFVVKSRSAKSTGASTNLDATGYATSGLPADSSNVDTTGTNAPDTNDSWLARVAKEVSASNGGSPSGTYAAIKAWLDGETIDVNQQKIVDSALSLGGTPPQGTSGISTIVDNVTGYVKPFNADTIYAVQQSGKQTPLTYDQWQGAGAPAPATVDPQLQTITGYQKSATAPDIYAVDAGGNKTDLTYAQWVALGSPNPTVTGV